MRAAAAVALAALVLTVPGCGGDDDGGGAGRIDVAAAASLSDPLQDYAAGFEDREGATVAIRFAGSDELAAQIRQGVRTDLYLAADERLPAELHDEGELEAPRTFASNRLVLITPRDGEVAQLADLDNEGVALALGDPGVPVGRYAREAIPKLSGVDAARVLLNVRSEEPDVKGVVGKVARGGADAGIVYATDARAAGDEVNTIEVPPQAQPAIRYAGAIVDGTERAELAQRFFDGLIEGEGRRTLDAAEFE